MSPFVKTAIKGAASGFAASVAAEKIAEKLAGAKVPFAEYVAGIGAGLIGAAGASLLLGDGVDLVPSLVTAVGAHVGARLASSQSRVVQLAASAGGAVGVGWAAHKFLGVKKDD